MPDLTLYELVPVGREGASFSPYVWSTKVDLAILGVEYTTDKRSFEHIRNELAQETGNDQVTVPTLKLASGEYITDSWEIADYLEKTYGSPEKTLFPGGETGRAYLNFLKQWIGTTFGSEVRPLVAPSIYHSLDAPSKDIWLKNRFANDQAKLDTFLAFPTDPKNADAQIKAGKARLQVLEDVLKAQKAQSKDGEVWLAGGKPSHADGVIFGFYVFHSVNERVKREVWELEEFGEVRAWIERVKGLIRVEELP